MSGELKLKVMKETVHGLLLRRMRIWIRTSGFWALIGREHDWDFDSPFLGGMSKIAEFKMAEFSGDCPAMPGGGLAELPRVVQDARESCISGAVQGGRLRNHSPAAVASKL